MDNTNERRRDMALSPVRAVEGEGRRISLSFSSEEPCERFWGTEILDHKEGAADLSRLNEIGCLLFNHDRDAVIGKVLRAWVEDGRGQAEVEFDTDQESDRIFQKVQAGTLKGVSVSYRIDAMEEVQAGKTSADGRFTGPCQIARKWTPYEISIVSVPADSTVGVGRELEEAVPNHSNKESRRQENMDERQEARDLNPQVQAAPEQQAEDNTRQLVDEAIVGERQRVSGITALCRSFGMEPDAFIEEGKTLEETRAAVLEELQKRGAPLTSRVTVGESGEDEFRRDAAEGLVLRGGVTLENPGAGARTFSQMSLRDLAIECLERAGEAGARRMSSDELFSQMQRQYYNPTAAFPSILDTAIEKAYVQGHKQVPVTFDKWTKKGTLSDFKVHDNNYLAGPIGDFQEVPEGGELKQDKPVDKKLPTRRLKTFGKQFTLSRQAFINDDIGLVTSIPARHAAAARRTINRQCYEILMKNPKIYDGKDLFGTDHKNLISTGTGITKEAVQAMILALSTQKDQFDQAVTIRPAMLVLPVGMGFDLYTLFNSPTIQTSGNTQAANPLYRYGLEQVEDPEINRLAGTGASPWFLLGATEDTAFIEVDYLNGQEVPTIRRMESPGQLGFVWDVYLDWGINVMDYRGAVKNPGVKIENTLLA